MEANNAILERFEPNSKRCVIDYLELNSIRNRTVDFESKFAPYRKLLADGKYDLVVGVLDDAIQLLLKHVPEFPKELPVVLCGYQELPDGFKARYPNVTGVAIDFRPMECVKLGLKLMPDTREVAIITDDFTSGKLLHSRLQQEVKNFKTCKLTLISGTEYNTRQMLDYVAKMPRKSFVVFCPWRNFAKDGFSSLEAVADEIARLQQRPYFIITDVLFNHGTLGGYVSRGERSGELAAGIMEKILSSGGAETIPFAVDGGELVIDRTVFDRADLNPGLLPPDTIQLNRIPTLWETHRPEVITSGIVVLIIVVLLITVIILFLRTCRAMRLLNKNLTMLQYGAKMAHLSYFDSENGQFSPNEMAMGSNWGGHLTPAEWVHPDDLADFEEGWRRLQNHEIGELTLSYRSNYTGETRHYALLAVRQPDNRCFGIIQDVTDITVNEHKYHDTSALLKVMLDNLPCAVFAKDVDDGFRYVIANQHAVRFFKSGVEDAIGKDDFELFPGKELAAALRQEDEELLRGSGSLEVTMPFSDQSGCCHFLRLMKAVITQSDGRRLLIGVGIDITEMEAAKAREVEAKNLLQMIFDHVPVGILVKDPEDDFRYVIWNKALETHTGVTVEDVIGKTDRELNIYPGMGEIFRQQDLEVMEMPEGKSFVETLPTAGGTITYRTFKAPLDINGRKLLVGLFVNLTQEQQMIRERQEMIARLNNYVENERIINSCLAQTVLEEDFGRNVDEILRIIATQLHSDRAYFGVYEQDSEDFTLSHEWLNTGVKSLHLPQYENFLKLLQERCREFGANETLQVSDIPNSICASALQETNCKSLLCVPVWRGDVLFGVLGVGFVAAKREFSELDETIMHSAAKIITLAKEHELQRHALDASVRERQIIFKHIKIPIMLFDRNGQLLRINPAAGAIAGYTEEELLQRPCYHSFCGEECTPAYCPVRYALDNGSPASVELSIRGREFIISAEPIFDENGAIVNVVESAVDVTVINESKRRLEEAMKTAQTADRAKSYFLATMSHELRTPLNAVIGFSELLELGEVTPGEQKEYLRSINLAGKALLSLINDVLDLSRIEADQMAIVPVRTDFAMLLNEILAIFRHKAHEKDLDLSMEISGTLPSLYLDSLRLRQVLLNLTGNALKFTHSGEVILKTEFVIDDADTGTLTIRVSDTGIGIPPEFQKRIFDPFVQQDSVRGNRTYEGSGLGLAISQRLIVKMGGELSVESAAGKGSTFTVKLAGVRYEKNAAPGEHTVTADDGTAKEAFLYRVLLVDDVPMNLKVLSSMLKHLGASFCCAASGAEAIAILRKQQFDALLTDMWMPGMNGEQLAAAVRVLPECAGMRIYAVTADTGAGENFELSLFDGVLHKPLSMEKLKELLESQR